jgi:hypothetical protein
LSYRKLYIIEYATYCILWVCWLILGEEYKVRVLQNRVLVRIFELKRDELTGGWRELHNEELHDLYC